MIGGRVLQLGGLKGVSSSGINSSKNRKAEKIEKEGGDVRKGVSLDSQPGFEGGRGGGNDAREDPRLLGVGKVKPRTKLSHGFQGIVC